MWTLMHSGTLCDILDANFLLETNLCIRGVELTLSMCAYTDAELGVGFKYNNCYLSEPTHIGRYSMPSIWI
jgi:hypothetical protein